MPLERMLVVANSRKLGGRCLAGLSLTTGSLVRPVSPHGGGELSDHECTIQGRTPALLEIVSFEHEGPEGDPAQPENLVISGVPWTCDGALHPRDALQLLRPAVYKGSLLLGNRGKAVPEDVAAQGMDASLALIELWRLRFGRGAQVESPHPGSPRALFTFRRRRWNLPLTDFDLGPKIRAMPEGMYGWSELGRPPLKRVLLTTSLGMAHEGWRYKLVAAVLPFP